MQMKTDERAKYLPHEDQCMHGYGNIDIFQRMGMSMTEIEHLEQASNEKGVDSLILFCKERGLPNVQSMFEANGARKATRCW